MQVQQLSSKSSRVATPAHTAGTSCWTRRELDRPRARRTRRGRIKPAGSPASTVLAGEPAGLWSRGAATCSAALRNSFYEASLTDLISIEDHSLRAMVLWARTADVPPWEAFWGGAAMVVTRHSRTIQGYRCIIWMPNDLLEGGYGHRFRVGVLPHVPPRCSLGARAVVSVGAPVGGVLGGCSDGRNSASQDQPRL